MSLLCVLALVMAVFCAPVNAMAATPSEEKVIYLEAEPRTYFLSDGKQFNYYTEFVFEIPEDCVIKSFKAIGTVNGSGVSDANVNIKLFIPYASVYTLPLDGVYHTYNTPTLTNRTITLQVTLDNAKYFSDTLRVAILLNDVG